VTPPLTVAEVTALLHRWYDPATAESWDAVGLVTGDPDAPVHRVLFAVDPVQAVIDEAVEWGATCWSCTTRCC
jgi:putative NIF3 family GTP cyclohydrolase 1 type 2